MSWFNYYGLIIMALIMIPNIIFAAKCQNGFENLWNNKTIEALEQAGRYGCFILMVFNIPGTWFGFWFKEAPMVYISFNAFFTAAYCAVWAICFNKNTVPRALALSIIPSVIFLFSAVILRSLPLLAAAVIFAPCHITISYKNAKLHSS